MKRLLLAAAAVLGLAQPAAADTYPSRAVRFVVPFTPGGSTDILARVVSQKLSEALGQQFVVDNRPGAGGTVGSEIVARAPADGYTLMMGHIGTLAVNPGLYQKLSYDPIRSFQPITLVAIVANVLAVHPSVPAENARQLIEYAKANPGKLTFGSGGNGSAAHIAMAAFMYASGTEMLHVPYRGTGPMVNDLLAGQISLTMTGGPAVLPTVRAGKLRALGVSSARPISAAPDLPTLAEAAGLPGFDATQWYGVVAPAGLPRDITDRLNAEIRKALTAPEVKERLAAEGADAAPGTPEELGRFIEAEMSRWGDLIRKTNLKVD